MQHRLLKYVILAGLFFYSTILAVEPHRSADFMVSSNGHCLIAYHHNSRKVDGFFPHLPDSWDVGEKTPNLIKAAGFKIKIDDVSLDLDRLPVINAGYINGTGIIRIEQKTDKLKITTYVWAPMTFEFKSLFLMVDVETEDLLLRPKNFEPYFISDCEYVEGIRCQDLDVGRFQVCQAVIYTPGIAEETLEVMRKELALAKPLLLLEAEQRNWMHWHRMGQVPNSIISKKYSVLKQSLAFLRMAQVQEKGPGFGQIVQNLSPHSKSYAHPRDMAYAIIALSRTGHYSEAKNALTFMLNAGMGIFYNYRVNGVEWGMPEPYVISLAYYGGVGYEKTDLLNGEPVLYLDAQGLFLWALSEYARESTDFTFVSNNRQKIIKYVINPLLASIDETGLIRRDSGLYNYAAPGEHFSFTSLCAFKGLNSAITLAHTVGDYELENFYTKKAAALRSNIMTKLTTGKAKLITKSLETTSFPELLDGSMIEAVNWRVVKPDWKTSNTIKKTLQVFLQAGDKKRGFVSGYANENEKLPENLFTSLRSVNALRKLDDQKRADQILDWVIEQSVRNGCMVPEYFTLKEADYLGSYPVIGQGAGVFIMAVINKK